MARFFGGGVAFVEKGEAQPMPIVAAHRILQGWLVGQKILFKFFGGIRIEIHMRESVIAEREAGVTPQFQKRSASWLLPETLRIDETVDARRVRSFQAADDAVGHVQAGHSRGQRTVHRKIIEGEGDFVRGRGSVGEWRSLDVTARPGQEGGPVGASGVATGVLTISDVAVNERGFDGRKIGGAQIFLAE